MRTKRNPAAYKPESVAEMHEAILNGELENYLGYESNSKVQKSTDNRRNGYSAKKLQTSMGETEISIPRDRNSDF